MTGIGNPFLKWTTRRLTYFQGLSWMVFPAPLPEGCRGGAHRTKTSPACPWVPGAPISGRMWSPHTSPLCGLGSSPGLGCFTVVPQAYPFLLLYAPYEGCLAQALPLCRAPLHSQGRQLCLRLSHPSGSAEGVSTAACIPVSTGLGGPRRTMSHGYRKPVPRAWPGAGTQWTH